MKYQAHLIPTQIYHIYNRTNAKELLFKNDLNKVHFLEGLKHYIKPYGVIYAYCLLDNHFHMLIQFHDERKLKATVEQAQEHTKLTKTQQQFLSEEGEYSRYNLVLKGQFHRWFTSYGMSFNKYWKRTGNLFSRPFKRVLIVDESQFLNTVRYVNCNAEKHQIVPDFKEYEWSSYHEVVHQGVEVVDKKAVLGYFGGLKKFMEFHEKVSPLEVTPFEEDNE